MVPRRKDDVQNVVINLDTLAPINSGSRSRCFQVADKISVVEREKQKRINVYHYVIHILAFLIVIPYISLMICGQEIPISYSTIVSVVIGFYFAKNLF